MEKSLDLFSYYNIPIVYIIIISIILYQFFIISLIHMYTGVKTHETEILGTTQLKITRSIILPNVTYNI